MFVMPIVITSFVFMLAAAAVARLTGSRLLTRLTLALPTLMISNFLLAGPLIVLVFVLSLNPALIMELTLMSQVWLPLATGLANWALNAQINLPFFSPLTATVLPVVIIVQVCWYLFVGRLIENVMFWFVWPQDR